MLGNHHHSIAGPNVRTHEKAICVLLTYVTNYQGETEKERCRELFRLQVRSGPEVWPQEQTTTEIMLT